jgi:hypothetical protein
MTAIRTSLIGTLSGWIAAFVWWVAIDIIYPHPHPPSDDTLDYVFIDVLFVVLGSPIAVALGLALWGFCVWLGRKPGLWQGPLWVLCGGVLGSVTFSLAVSPWRLVPVWPWRQGSFSLVPSDWGCLAGLVAFSVAFVLRYGARIAIPNSTPPA